MVIGNMLSDSGQQYVATKDDTGTWRILNTWHEELKTMNADDDISDDSPAVVVLSEGQFISLIKEAASQGVLENVNISMDADTAELEDEIDNKNQEIEKLKDQLSELKEEKTKIEKVASHSEEFELKEKAMDNILKLVSMQDMTKLSRD
jgi:septal ring factor EnvC (AmiA/AmiB activator)|tara:strand:+ start:1743 stop:2189 length:447 start_codon:yes stop_codon:yes gene_type:complete